MSTTPTTPERRAELGRERGPAPRELIYTVVGGPRPDRILVTPHRLAVVILNRGPRHTRPEALVDAAGLGAGEVISVERASVDVDTLSHEHPDVRFLLVRDEPSPGELINIGLAEARSRHVLLLWSDMRVDPAAVGPALAAADAGEALCLAPSLWGPDGGTVPVCSSPTLLGSRFSVLHTHPREPDTPTLYPFDYCGLYRKDRVAVLGGYDAGIGSPYWQKLDLGLRTHLFGGSIRVHRDLRVAYRSEIPAEDTTPDPAYRRFYLRNVAVRFRGEGAYLPLVRFLPFFLLSGTGPAAAAGEFRDARRWIRGHRRSYRRDLKELVESWGSEA